MVLGSAPLMPDQRGLVVRPGARLGHYEVLTHLGSGGMATVWLARAVRTERFERLVALKTVHPELSGDPGNRELFLREAQIASTIHHANVIDVIDVGEVDGVLYQVMSLVEGIDLRAVMDRHGAPLPTVVLTSILIDALRGLHAAHESVDSDGRSRHLVHRDVSPQNILVGLDGVARVSDFGIARSLSSYDETTTAMRGKFAYFSPEQATRGLVDRRSDIFAMGIVLWEGLTGERLFRGKDPLECLELVRERVVPPPSDLRPEVDRALGDVALRALTRDPAGRYATAADMASALVAAARTAKLEITTDAVARFVDALMGAEVRERVRRIRTDEPTAQASPVTMPASAGTVSYVSEVVAARASPSTVPPRELAPSVPPSPPSAAPSPPAASGSPARRRAAALLALACVAVGFAALVATKLVSRPATITVANATTSSVVVEENEAKTPPVATGASTASAVAAAPDARAPESGSRPAKTRVRRKTSPRSSTEPPFANNPFRR